MKKKKSILSLHWVVFASISTFLNELSEYEKQNDIQFTKVEKMQLLNIAPKVPVDVYLVYELYLWMIVSRLLKNVRKD